MLRARIYEHELRKQQAEQQNLKTQKSDIGWGIRFALRNLISRASKIFVPTMKPAMQAVLDGDLDDFIEASLKQGV